jgi:hypothetical protein
MMSHAGRGMLSLDDREEAMPVSLWMEVCYPNGY